MMKGTINKKVARFDITAVYTHPDAKVDIVLLHGLNGDPQKTWTAKAKNGAFWPADLLPNSLEEDNAPANVLVYGYNADVSSKRHGTGPSTNYIHQHAQTLVTFLTTYRKSKRTTRNPIIWVAHSLGGILLKRALEYSDSVRVADHEDYRSIYVSTYGIIFLGTPHDGSELASWGSALQGMAGHIPRKFFDSEPVLIETLRKDNETLDNINMNFLNIYQRFKIHMVHENQKTDLRGTRSLIVDAKSAAPRLPGVTSYGIEADHSGMCKFESADAPGYRQVSTAIVEWVQEAPGFISVRWNVEDEDRRVRVQLEINERARPYFTSPPGVSAQVAVHLNETSSNVPSQEPLLAAPSPLPLLFETRPMEEDLQKTPEFPSLSRAPLFIHPEAFRPNSYFVGRTEELDDLHRMLQDRKRRSEGTSTVLIRCQTGGGKTHLARQYVFLHKDDYPGGIFWLRAKSVEELDGEFWRVARTAALKDLMNEADIDELRDSTKIVDLVRRWLNGLEGWLMVLDGIMFDTPGIERFVPDAANSSLILTSTDPAATGDHHFNNPQRLELPLLAVQDAQELLLLETEKKRPWSQEDRRQATELVLMLGRLPLLIHVTAQNLKANQEPLATFLKRYRIRPKVGKVPAYEYVLEQLHGRGATAALNVMSILVFFDHHIPVEMMAMGLRALGKELPYKTRDAATHGRPSLSNTLRVLIAFALVDRTESQEVSPASSQSSKRSLDLPSESLDTLQIHNVIQRYCVESLVERKEHAFWLERAYQVFFKAFNEADRRIKENPRAGLPDDYRRFYVHGKRLAEHLVKHEKRNPELRPLRETLEKKLDVIHAEIHSLSEKIQAMIVDHSDDIPQASIFDRANSLSESDSATSGSQNHSQQDIWTHMDDDDPRFFHSPTSFGPGVLYDMYGLPIPYPDTTTIPGPSFQDEDGGDPTPHVTPKMGSNTVSGDNPQNGWTTVAPKPHRHQRQTSDSLISQNQYQKGQAQVGISHDIAKPPFFHTSSPGRGSSRSPSKSRLSAQSEAELSLAKLRRVSPPPPRGGGVIQDKGRSLSSSLSTKPRDIIRIGEYSYARVASGLTPTDEMSQAEFYRGYDSMPVTDSSYTAATLKKFKENFLQSPGKDSSSNGSSAGRAGPQAAESIQTSPGFDQPATMPPFPVVAGSRTARSSPGQVIPPFYPPGLSVERATAGDFWRNTQHSSYEPLGMVGLTAQGQGQGQPGDVPMAISAYPIPSTIWIPIPDEVAVSSAPMSRDSSAQSSSSRPRLTSTKAPPPSHSPRRGRRHSSPLSSPVSPLPLRLPTLPSGRSRPPSIVTEPSPRLQPTTTRYDNNNNNSSSNIPDMIILPPRPRAGSNSSGSGALLHQQQQPPTRPRWYRRASGRLSRGRDRDRTQSQSPAAAPRMASSLHATSPGPSASSPTSSSSAAAAGGGGGGEAMARSGSGGIVVGGGRMIGFGEVPATGVDLSSQRSLRERQQVHRRGFVEIGLPPVSSGAVVGLGIMRETE